MAGILALDLGSQRTGWAVGAGFTPVKSGVWGLGGCPSAYWRLQDWLSSIYGKQWLFDVVSIEAPLRCRSYARSWDAVRAACGLAGVVEGWADQRNLVFVEIHPAEIKRRATGNPVAPKEDVLSSAVSDSGHSMASADEADAYWLWHVVNDKLRCNT